MQDKLELMWDENRDYLRRLLIGLSRDIDLADDLLQETFLKARAGIEGYRGRDARAWLAAIAKNAFFSYKRRKYVRHEILLESNDVAVDEPDHISVMEVREAVAGLSEILRTTLVMKHFGGYSYEEIAERLDCPVGTAKRRVNVALRKLRTALTAGREEPMEMKCIELTDRLLLDFIYGKLSESEQKPVEKHLAACEACPGRVKEIAEVLRALDRVEDDFRISAIIEYDDRGAPVEYVALSLPDVAKGQMAESMEIGASGLTYVSVGGTEARFEQLPEKAPNGQKYRIYLPRPYGPGEKAELLLVSRPPQGLGWANRLEDGRWRLEGKLHLTEKLVYVVAIRLPAGAKVVTASPEPSEVRANCTTTVIWRNVLQPGQQVDFWLEYRP